MCPCTGRTGVLTTLAVTLAVVLLAGCSPASKAPEEVVVYSSVDEVFARPIAERFEQKTGIKVRLVPDTEETKSTGLLNRLIAEKQRPQADVFWSGDPVRAALLKSKGVSAAYQSPEAKGLPALYSDSHGHWTGFSARARVLIYNTNLVSKDKKPSSVMDLLDARFRGKSCIANPLFGTTSMHAAALFQVLGDEKAKEFFNGFIANGGTVLSSNGEVRRRVAAGDFAIGITDTDDAHVAVQEGRPVAIVYPDAGGMGTLIIPNAAVLIAGAPHAVQGKRFIDYLLSPETEQALAESDAAQMPVRPGVPVPEGMVRLEQITPMRVDYMTLASKLDELNNGFLKEWVGAHAQ